MIRFNNSQRRRDLDRHIALDAGAGTGKTTVMAERYVQHLFAADQRATHVTPLGPRTPLSGHGALRAPKRERTAQSEWPGLLPSEVVAITFTRKSAAELKARIRHRLAQARTPRPRRTMTVFLTRGCATTATWKCSSRDWTRHPFQPSTPFSVNSCSLTWTSWPSTLPISRCPRNGNR